MLTLRIRSTYQIIVLILRDTKRLASLHTHTALCTWWLAKYQVGNWNNLGRIQAKSQNHPPTLLPLVPNKNVSKHRHRQSEWRGRGTGRGTGTGQRPTQTRTWWNPLHKWWWLGMMRTFNHYYHIFIRLYEHVLCTRWQRQRRQQHQQRSKLAVE